MEKSIENIWTTGFMNSEELVTPKIENLYDQKSTLLLDKFKRTYQIDNKALIPIAIVLGLGLGFFGYVILGIYVALLLTILYFVNRKLLQSLERITISTNSYDYLTIYRKTIKSIVNTTTKIVGFVFPLAIIPGYWLFFSKTEMYIDIINTIEPFQLFMAVGLLAIVLGLICIAIYRLTTKLTYGSYLDKLDDLISDMKHLKSN
jgi:hypothetical protein